jgi:TetR/AcrR family transcriptional repressor of nem operon
MQAFWAKGYEATSLADLMAATGLHKGSLYQAFGDKHSLFILALQRYLEEMRTRVSGKLRAGPTPREGLSNAAHDLLEMADSDEDCPRGCLAINALVELAPHDDSVKEIMMKHLEYLRATIGQAISEGQEAGQIDKGLPPAVLTGLMMTFMAGLATNLKGALDKDQAHQLLDVQLEAIF